MMWNPLTLTGWGRTAHADMEVGRPERPRDLAALLADTNGTSIVVHGGVDQRPDPVHECEVSEVVGGELRLPSRADAGLRARHDRGVVDHDVDRVTCVEQRPGERGDAVEVGEVERPDGDRVGQRLGREHLGRVVGSPSRCGHACTHTDDGWIRKTTVQLQPGVYCGGLRVDAKNIMLRRGIYVIKDGPLILRGSSKIKGDDVGIFLTGDGTHLDIDGKSKVDITAAEDGEMAAMHGKRTHRALL